VPKYFDGYIDPELIEFIRKNGCDECYLFSFKVISDFSKFIKFILNKSEIVVLFLSSLSTEKGIYRDIAKNLGRQKQISVYVFFSDKLPSDNFIVCYKLKSNQNV